MKILFFLVLILIIIFMYFYYEKKLTVARNKLLQTSSQFNNIKNKYNNIITKNQNVNIHFLTPTINTAITNNNTTVFLAPMLTSPKVKVLDIKMEVKILDSAIIDDETWFYISLPIDSAYNCRGWINKNDFSYIHQESEKTVSIYK